MPGSHPGHCRLPSYRIFTYRFRYRAAFPSSRTISRLDLYTSTARRGAATVVEREQANDLETVMHTPRDPRANGRASEERAGR